MELDDLREEAQDAARAERWEDFLTYLDRLRADTDMWISLWAPVGAIAARELGHRDEAHRLLAEAIDGGFFQPDIFGLVLPNAFGADDEWPALHAAMIANTPPPPIALQAWPTVRPTAPYTLFRLAPEHEELLRDRIPAPQAAAWATAQALLAWVTARWEHTSSEHAEPDALVILDRVDAGERFACREYAAVLSQALNAVGIPSRRVGLRNATSHAGLGAGHMVAEAWIDDLDRWVLLDGQNGIFWTGSDGDPLGVLDLHERFRSGLPRPDAVLLGHNLDAEALDMWWAYFAKADTGTATWGVPGHVPYFEGAPNAIGALLAHPAEAYPDFAELVTTIVVADGSPAVLPRPAHPYAIGYRVTSDGTDVDLALDESWPIPATRPGDHTATIATRTPYRTLRPSELRFTVG